MSSFIPSTNPNAQNDLIENDGFFPDIELDDVRNRTGLSDVFTNPRIVAATRDAMIEINRSLGAWRTNQTVADLASVPAIDYGETSEKVHLYLTAVCARVRSVLVDTTRDYDSSKSGHDRADALEQTSDRWMQISNEALSRLMDRPRTNVELI